MTLPGLYERMYACGRYVWGPLPQCLGEKETGSRPVDGSDPAGPAKDSEGWSIEMQYERFVDEAGTYPEGVPVHCVPVQIPWVSVSPSAPDRVIADFPGFRSVMCHARTVVLNPGDMLYLPSLWYHEVCEPR